MTIIAPFISSLEKLGILYTVNYSDTAAYTEHYDTYLGPLLYGNIGLGIAEYGGCLTPRSIIETNNANFMKMARNITKNEVIFTGIATNIAPFTKSPTPSSQLGGRLSSTPLSIPHGPSLHHGLT